MTDTTRENWLVLMGDSIYADIIAPHATKLGLAAPPVRYSVGFPLGARAGKALGVCHNRAQSTDGHNEIFISPTSTDSLQIAATLVHELIHAVDDCESGHKSTFAKLARLCGLEGKLTATTASEPLNATLQQYIDALGDIPMPPMIANARAKPKQRSRKLKVVCSAQCGWSFEVSRKQYDAINAHMCLSCGYEGLEIEERACN